MKRLLYLLLISWIFVSCSSNRLPLQPTQKIHIFSKEEGNIVYNQDTITLKYAKYQRPKHFKNTLKIPRSKNPLHFKFAGKDSLVKDYVLLPKNIKPNYEDPIPDKSYSYPGGFWLLSQDTIVHQFKPFKRPGKGSVYLNISLPYINSFNFVGESQRRASKFGFLGASLGLDYYHSSKQFLTLSYSSSMTFFLTSAN